MESFDINTFEDEEQFEKILSKTKSSFVKELFLYLFGIPLVLAIIFYCTFVTKMQWVAIVLFIVLGIPFLILISRIQGNRNVVFKELCVRKALTSKIHPELYFQDELVWRKFPRDIVDGFGIVQYLK